MASTNSQPAGCMTGSPLLAVANGTQLVGDAAAALLYKRLEAVLKSLKPAAKSAADDPEHVHRLRVATRRATAAIEVFGEVLPEKKSRRLLRQLKRIRRAAGPARDLDVLRSRLPSETAAPAKLAETEQDAPSSGPITTLIARDRELAQRRLRRMFHKTRSLGLRKRCRKLLKKVAWRGKGAEPAFPTAARTAFATCAERFLSTGAEDLQSGEALHEFRIAGKRLRYTLELLESAFPTQAAANLIAAVKEVQDRLGAVNDHLTAQQIIREWANDSDSSATQPCLEAFAQAEGRAAVQEKQAFESWWSDERLHSLQLRVESLLGVDAASEDVTCR